MHFLVQPLLNPVLDHTYVNAIAAKIKSGMICDCFISVKVPISLFQ